MLDALAEDGVYVSQFVTGISNGGLTAHPGGDRWRWGSRMFGGAYDEARAGERPVYGALNYRRRVVGGAQVHGSVRLERDVEAVVLDPSYRGTPVECAAQRLPCAVEWHEGFRLTVDVLREHADYRGPQYVELGERIAVDRVLTPRVIGEAVGEYGDQELKRVWHCLARFGLAGWGHGAEDSGWSG